MVTKLRKNNIKIAQYIIEYTMENIHIYDGFLEPNELNIIAEKVKMSSWNYGHTSNDTQYTTPFFIINLENDAYFSIYLKQKIEEYTKKRLELIRVYINGQVYGQNGSYHQDSQDSDDITFLLYINPIPPQEIEIVGGNTSIKLPNESYVISVEPQYNRLLQFPATYFHKGDAFTRYVKEMRMSIAWKFTEKKREEIQEM
jgi:hypothetical protein